MTVSKRTLQRLYSAYNRRKFVHPDPLEFLYDYPGARDRELAALVASSLAYGNVRQILRSASAALDKLTDRPAEFLAAAKPAELKRLYSGFKHRFTTGGEMAAMLSGAKRIIEEYGSLEAGFVAGLRDGDETAANAERAFLRELRRAGGQMGTLIPDPDKNSALKRFNLCLRWLVRHDAVDPGGWNGLPPSKLIVPLDTHMHKIGLALGLTCRKQADMRTALEITGAFRALSPEDPVKYDFCLTRFGIRDDMDLEQLRAACAGITAQKGTTKA